jgi:hypothetical protein
MEVLINEMANIPHHDGQIVLHAKREDIEVKISFSRGQYWVCGSVFKNGGKASYTNLMASRKTVREARNLAHELWRDGTMFNVTIGNAGKKS